MYVCMYVYVMHVCMYLCTDVRICMYVERTYVCVCMYVYVVCMYLCSDVRVCMYVCMNVYFEVQPD